MTLPVPNTQSPIVNPNSGIIVPPWNAWFQQFSQKAPKVLNQTVGTSPFSFRANNIGQVIVRGGIVSAIALIRGNVTIDMTGALSVFVSIGDIVKVTYSGLPTIQFVEQ